MCMCHTGVQQQQGHSTTDSTRSRMAGVPPGGGGSWAHGAAPPCHRLWLWLCGSGPQRSVPAPIAATLSARRRPADHAYRRMQY